MEKQDGLKYSISILAVAASAVFPISIPAIATIGVGKELLHIAIDTTTQNKPFYDKAKKQLKKAFYDAKKETISKVKCSERAETLTLMLNENIFMESICVEQAIESATKYMSECPSPNDVRLVYDIFTKCLESEVLKYDELCRILFNKRLDRLEGIQTEQEIKDTLEKNDIDSKLVSMQNVILNQYEGDSSYISSLIRQGTNHTIIETSKIFEQLEKLFGILNGTNGSILSSEYSKFNSQITFSSNNGIFEALLVMPNGSNRKKSVDEIIKMLDKYSWVHIYGEMWSGKTQLLALLAERIAYVEFINMELFSLNQIYNIIYSMEDMSVLIIDNLTNISSESIKSLVSMVKKVNYKNVTVISSGYHDLKILLRDYNAENFYVSYPIPVFTMDEVVEVLARNKMPDNFNYSSLIKYFDIVRIQSPALLMEIIYYLIDHDWKITNEFLDLLLLQEFKNLEEKMESLLLQRLTDSDSRKLLYRLAYVGHRLSDTNISDIAKIGFRIDNWEKRISVLKGAWLMLTEKGYYEARKEIRVIAQKNLSKNEKRLIDEYMVEFFSTKKLDYFDFLQLLGHLKNLEKYDIMGYMCFQYIQQAIKNDYKSASEYVTDFWVNTPIPPMSSFVKFLVRISQLQYLEICKKDNSNVMKEFNNLLETDDEISYLLPIGVIMTSFNTITVSLDLFSLCQKNNSWHKFKEKYSRIFSEINVPQFNDLDDIRDFSLISIMIQIETINDGEYIFEILQAAKTEDIMSMESNILFCNSWGMMWEKLRINTNLENSNSIECLLLNVMNFLERIRAFKLYGIIFRSWLRYYSDNIKNYDIVKDEYKNRIGTIEHEVYANELAIDTMGKIALDFNDDELGLQLLGHRITNIKIALQNEFDTKFDDVCTCIAFLQRSLKNPKIKKDSILEAQDKLYMLSKTNDDFILSETGNEMIMGEYFISMYLYGRFEQCFFDFANFTEKILNEKRKSIKEVKELVSILSHCFTYIKADILYNNPPLTLGTEKYAPPDMRMFWVFDRNEELQNYDSMDRRLMIRLALADMAQYYGFDDIAKRNILEVVKQEIQSTLILPYFIVYSHFHIQLLKMNKFNELANITLNAEKFIASDNRNEKYDELGFTKRFLLVDSIYLVWLHEVKNENAFLNVCEKMIEVNSELTKEKLFGGYYKEYCRLLQMFINEGFDYDLFLLAYEMIKDKNVLPDMCNIIYPFFILVAKYEKRKAYIENIKILVKSYGLEKEYQLHRFIDELKF